MIWFSTLISVVIISVLSLSGAIALALSRVFLRKILLILVAFSTGALLGDAFLHLLPQAVESAGGFGPDIAVMVFVGILLFFSLEKFLRWRHCHDVDCTEHATHLGTMNLVGDGVHNFIDGVLIAASYMVSIPLGITTTIAVAAHEIPQELGDFGILLHSGFKKRQAVVYNFISASFAVVGSLITLVVGTIASDLIIYLVPVTAGGFIYISLSGLVPELHKEGDVKKSLIQFLSMILGIVIMYLLLFVE